MTWKQYLLKVDYFVTAEERLRGMLIILLMLISVLVVSISLYGAIQEGHEWMPIFQSLVIIVILIAYILFPYYISLKKIEYLVLAAISTLILAKIYIPSYNHEFVLFALASLPAGILFFLGAEVGYKWNAVIAFVLSIILANSYIQWTAPQFSTEVLLQVFVSYVALSYFYYEVEKERTGYEKELAASIEAKSILLKEVHHRAKNNLQTIIGLLESQAFRVKDEECKKTLTSQRHRLQSMSFIHESLCNDFLSEQVDVSKYIGQIVDNLQDITKHSINFKSDSFMLDMSDAINLGLFLNEGISNAIEHAYDAEDKGRIEVLLKYHEPQCVLMIKDFGKGFDTNEKYDSLGLVLMEDISNFFDNGSMTIDVKNGSEIMLIFSIV